jgi:hypothetical protein
MNKNKKRKASTSNSESDGSDNENSINAADSSFKRQKLEYYNEDDESHDDVDDASISTDKSLENNSSVNLHLKVGELDLKAAKDELKYAPLIHHYLKKYMQREHTVNKDKLKKDKTPVEASSVKNTQETHSLDYSVRINSSILSRKDKPPNKDDALMSTKITDNIVDNTSTYNDSNSDSIVAYAEKVHKSLKETFPEENRFPKEFPYLKNFLKLPKTFIMKQIQPRFIFDENKILIYIDENIQQLYLSVLNSIENHYPLLFLSGLEGIGKSTALYTIQSYLRLDDQLRIVYVHDLAALLFGLEVLKNEIYFTFYQDKDLIDSIKAIESKESITFERELQSIFKLLETHCHCQAEKKKLIVIFDNYNRIDYYMHYGKPELKETVLAHQLDDYIRHWLKSDLTIISSSCNNETKEDVMKPIYGLYSYYDSFMLNAHNIAKLMRANFVAIKLDPVPVVSQKQAELIKKLTNGVYLEVKQFFRFLKEESFDFEKAIKKYRIYQQTYLSLQADKFYKEKIKINEADNNQVRESKKLFQRNFIFILVSMKCKTPVSFEFLKYLDKCLMFYSESAIGNYFYIQPRNQVAYQVLLDSYGERIRQMTTQSLIELIQELKQLKVPAQTRRALFKILLQQSFKNAEESIDFKNIQLHAAGKMKKKIDIYLSTKPVTIEFYKQPLPNIYNKNDDFLFIPMDFNYPLFDFFIVTEVEDSRCLLCFSATNKRLINHSRKDLSCSKEKEKIALFWYKYLKENDLERIIEVYITPAEFGAQHFTFSSLNNIYVDRNCLYDEFFSEVSFF